MAHDSSYNTGFYIKQGGGEVHFQNPVSGPDGTGCRVVAGSTGIIVAGGVTFTPAAGTSNICNVSIQFNDGLGNALDTPVNFDWWLSDAVTGAGLTATTASGTVQLSTGEDLVEYVSKKAGRGQTTAAGLAVLEITDSAKTGFYVCVAMPSFGYTRVSSVLITANYG